VGVDPPDEPKPRRPEFTGFSTRTKVGVGAFVGVLYAIGAAIWGHVLPAVIGGILAGILTFLVLREVEQRRQRRLRR
jgi:hypothetical protein